MKYKVLEYFTDLQDNNYAYHVGDTYPREGYTPTKERIEELASDKNIRKRPVIVAIAKNETTTIEEAPTPSEKETVEQEEKPKKRKHNKDDE